MDTIINDIIKLAEEYDNISKIVLFGSRARKDNKNKSDIDLAIYSQGDISGFKYRLNNEINTLLEFDITEISDKLDCVFLQNIKNEGIVIYEKS